MLGDQPRFGVGTTMPAECADRKVRMVQITREADTFFSVPARVTVKGKTVRGHVYWQDSVLRFSPDAWRPNAALLPSW